MIKRSAFTLAEVLITLGIIGVVAALTIPALITNSQNMKYITGLKKAYASINEVLIKMAADNGQPGDLKSTGLFTTGTTDDSFGDEFVKYFNVLKNCGTSELGCFPDIVSDSYDGSNNSSGWDQAYRFITTDGMSVRVSNEGNDCDGLGLSNNITGNMTQVCGEIYIDVNGPKGPNYMGRDIFDFWISNGKGPLLYPYGGADDNDGATWADASGTPQNCISESTAGYTCAGRVMEENWQMNY